MSRLFTFVGGNSGIWQVVQVATVRGDPLLEIVSGPINGLPAGAQWSLRGITSNERYVNRAEKMQLTATQPALGRPGATCAALIPIRKNAAWWSLPQDERRKIFEESSHHV